MAPHPFFEGKALGRGCTSTFINVVSSGGMCHGQCELIVKFNKQELSDFLTENLPILNPYSAQKSENLRPHSRNSIENATPLQSIPS